MADQLAFLPERVLTAAAMPGAGYKVSFYESGTTTPVAVYTSADLSTPHPVPLVCDATGVFPQVFSAGGAIKAVVTKPDDSAFYTIDPVLRVPTSASGASEITFASTVDLPFTNVQDAIEGAAASAASGFTPFGLGVTGTNALIADLDATGTASGSYRFDATTTGTYPTGVAASDTGTVQIWRENSGDAVMFLQAGPSFRQFTRRLVSSAWQVWREIVNLNSGAADGDLITRTSGNWSRLGIGATGQILTVSGGVPTWGGPVTTVQGTLSGTSTNIFTGLPSSVERINVWIRSASLAAAGYGLLQVGTGGAFVSTGYVSGSDSRSTSTQSTAGFNDIGSNNLAGNSWDVAFRLRRVGTAANTWQCDHTGNSDNPLTFSGAGRVTLTTALDRIRYNTTSGTTFDGGSFLAEWWAI